ncbi:hypothetical protein ZWY2020_003962 [Hordeum vulgare]|nr:hypothetical protein ZWY2020_003962 [Hordeum vulgare]
MHWAFAYEMLQRVSYSFALGPVLRNAVCVFYLVQGLVLIPPWIRFLGARLGFRSGVKHLGGDMFKSIPSSDAIFMKKLLTVLYGSTH